MYTHRVALMCVLLAACQFGTDDRTCEDVREELTAELAEVQSCATDDACGQVLPGTSCGCTRDLVARLDADVSTVEALIAEGTADECDLGLISTCDCPEADGFLCDFGVCAWDYVDATRALPQCEAADGDPLTIASAMIEGHTLVATVSYGGGCEAHDVTLCWPDPVFAESEPVQTWLELYHDAHDDPCDASITEQRAFDLTPLEAAWTRAYGPDHGTIVVHLDGFSLTHTF